MILSGFSYDDACNVSTVSSSSGQARYEFDDASRLSLLVTLDATGVHQSKSEFVYDGLSRLRISKTVTWTNGAWLQSGEVRRLYDGMNAVQERDGAGDWRASAAFFAAKATLLAKVALGIAGEMLWGCSMIV